MSLSPRTRSLSRAAVAGLALALAAAVLAPSASPAVAPRTAAAAAAPVTAVTGLTTNGRVNPLGIPGDAPSLGWTEESTGRGVVQSAYQVRVATSEDALASPDVWDSGQVASDQQVDVVYGGPALTSATRYVWEVKTWDGAGQESAWSAPATFETGLLSAADWDDAAWIGAAPGTELNRWTDYTADFDFHIDNLVFGTFVRAADVNNGYMWQLSVTDGTPRLRPHKRVNGGYTLLANKDISAFTTAAQLRTGDHTMSVTFDGPTITTKLDGVTIDTRTDTTFTKGFVGFRTDLANEGPEQQTVRDVRVTAKNGDTLLDTDFAAHGNPFSGGTLVSGGLQFTGKADAIWRSPDANLPLLRTDFSTETGKTVARARVYASAYGVYQLQLNGEQVGDQVLAPGWTDYRKRIQHQTYDVTDQVQAGDNAFGAEVGEGWWTGKIASFGGDQYGTNLGVIAQLRIDYTDGTHQVVATDPTWTSHYGPFVQADNLDGEAYDANAEQTGWDEPAYDDAAWTPVVQAASATARLVPQPDEPVRVTGEIPAVAHTTPAPGVEIYDLGQNMVGVPRLTLQGQAGKTVRIRYGEVLNRDGTLYTANMRSAKVTDYYTFDETGTATYTPTFTQHGFRYLEITGTTAAPSLGDVTGVVWGSDLTATGDLDTSDPMLNQLVSNISWGQRGNFLSVPTDTPARDERLGWTGDINVFAPTASYLRDTRAFLGKWMTDLRDAGYGNGNVPGIAPVVPNAGDFGSGLGWSDAAITVPYATWKAWGDNKMVRDNYEAMAAFLGFVRTSAGADLIDSERGHWEDWLNLDDPTGVDVLGTAYFAEDARMLSEMAAAIGEDGDAADFAALSADIRDAFTDDLVAANGTVKGNSQAGYAMALGMDMISDPALREKVAARFVAKLAASGNHLTTGFLGTPWLLPALSSIGRDDLAYTMLLQKDYPSWGYEIEHGATTMWERWNSIMPDGSFGPVEMNSFNHYAYGAVGDWMYRNIGGISPIEAGYHKSRIAPVVGGGLTHGAGDFASVYGAISTDWAVTGDDLSLAVEVPVNTTAEVVLPADNAYEITEDGVLLDDVEGVTGTTDDGDTVTVSVGSGSYDFRVNGGALLLGQVLVDLDALRAHVAELAGSGDLAAGDRDELDASADEIRADVRAALLATISGDDAGVTASLKDARSGVRELRAWLAASGIDAPVRGDLDARVASIEARLTKALTSAMGVSVALPPLTGPVLLGATATGTVEVTNQGSVPLTHLEGTVTVAGLGTATVSLAGVPVGGSVQLPVVLGVAKQAVPGTFDADLSLSYTAGAESFTVTDTTTDWVTVASGLTVGAVTAAADPGEPADHARVTVPVTNGGTADVRANVQLALPEGWRSVPSPDVLVPAGQQVSVTIPVVVPLDRVSGAAVPVDVDVRRAGVSLATSSGSVALDLARPPSTSLDHIDFGETTSENAHALQASPSSGIAMEAGLTRRYSNSGTPGSWFSAEVDVPAGAPFVLRSVDTYYAPVNKKYDVYVDGVLVHSHLLPRTEAGAGFKVYDVLVDDPTVLANDGTVRVRYEYPLGTTVADGFDPSIADLWVLAVPADTRAPDVSAFVTGGTPGDNGWFRSDVAATVSATDRSDDAPSVATDQGSGWQGYAGPVAVTGDGKHLLAYRATDGVGNVSAPASLPVWIDHAAPVTSLTAPRGAGVEAADRATLVFSAADATSGVAATVYRVDGGAWATVGQAPITVSGFGDHVVDFASTDVAGNPEVMQHATITLADVDTVAAVLGPQLSGVASIGSTLTATPGAWNTKALTFGYQWLRDGTPIAGATGTSYVLGVADVGTRVSVRVTATKPTRAPGVATSTATPPVASGAATVSMKVNKTSVGKKKPVKVTAVVTSSPAATGQVQVLVDGKVVKTAVLTDGTAVVAIRIAKLGKHKVQVVYPGAPGVGAAESAVRTVHVTRR
jgi:alpha-L-rhamnosidase